MTGFCRLCLRPGELRYEVCQECIPYVVGQPLLDGTGNEMWDRRRPSIRWIVTTDGYPYAFPNRAEEGMSLVELGIELDW